MYACNECGTVFRTARAADQATREGCPRCGFGDFGVAVSATPVQVQRALATARRRAKSAHAVRWAEWMEPAIAR